MEKYIATHRVVTGCKITENENTDTGEKYFLVIVRNLKEIKFITNTLKYKDFFYKTIDKVKEIRNKIDEKGTSILNMYPNIILIN